MGDPHVVYQQHVTGFPFEIDRIVAVRVAYRVQRGDRDVLAVAKKKCSLANALYQTFR